MPMLPENCTDPYEARALQFIIERNRAKGTKYYINHETLGRIFREWDEARETVLKQITKRRKAKWR